MKNALSILFLAGCVAFQSCAPTYIPNNTNVPLFTEPGEIQLAAYQGTNGTDLQAAVSVVDHLAVMGNFEISKHEEEDPEDYHKHNFGEIGIGFYDTFGGKGRFEFYGGYGSGKSETYDYIDVFTEDEQTRFEGKYDRWFLQGNIGLGNDIFEGAISYRVSYVNFYRLTEFGPDPNVAPVSTSMEELMMEPAITIKVGGKHIKFVSQWGFSFPYDDYARFDYQPFFWSAGIQGKIPAW